MQSPYGAEFRLYTDRSVTEKGKPMLDEAIERMRAAAGDDPRAAAILAWAQTRDRALLKTLAVVYRNADDEAVRRLGRAAADFIDHDTRAPFYDEGPLQLNMAAGTYMIGDRVKALDYLNRAVKARPEWRAHPVVADFARPV